MTENDGAVGGDGLCNSFMSPVDMRVRPVIGRTGRQHELTEKHGRKGFMGEKQNYRGYWQQRRDWH